MPWSSAARAAHDESKMACGADWLAGPPSALGHGRQFPDDHHPSHSTFRTEGRAPRLSHPHFEAGRRGQRQGLGRYDLGRCRGTEQLAADRQLLPAVPVGQQSVMADPDESRRQHVEKEPPEELGRLQFHRPSLATLGVVLVPEPHPSVLHPDQPAVADRHPVRVPGQVLQHLARAAERRLGVDDPLGLDRIDEKAVEPICVGEPSQPATELEPAPLEGGPEARQELAPEDAAQHPDRQEEAVMARDPSRAVGREPATRHNAMHMGVVLEVLPPGVEDGQEADLSPEVSGIGGDVQQGLRGGPEQQVVDNPRVLQGERAESRRQGENDVEILHRKQLGGAGLDPPRRLGGLALGAVAVAARVIRDLPVSAPVARLDMPAQGRRAAAGQVDQGTALLRGEGIPVRLEEGVAMSPDDVGDLDPWPVHGRSLRSSRSSGLDVVRNASGETWV